MSKVFVTQVPLRMDPQRGEMVPKIDLNYAKQYGELQVMLTPSAKPFTPQPIIEQLHEQLAYYSDDDYLLLLGSPAIMGWAAAIAARHNEGRITILQWNGIDKGYRAVVADLSV